MLDPAAGNLSNAIPPNGSRAPGQPPAHAAAGRATRMPKVSIVIPAHNEAHRLEETVRAIRATADLSYEMLVVDDMSTDGCAGFLAGDPFDAVRLVRAETPLGVAGARNAGARLARGPIVVFMDAHCYPEPGFLSRLVAALNRLGRGMVVPQVTAHGEPSARGFGMTLAGPELNAVWLPPVLDVPYPVPIGCGCIQMFFKSWFDQIGGYDTMRKYGVEDLEISMRSWLLGGPVHVVPQSIVAHYFRSATTLAVGWEDVVHNVLRMAHLHLSGSRLARVEQHWAAHPSYTEAKTLLGSSDVAERRQWLDSRRRRSADWYCDKFSIAL